MDLQDSASETVRQTVDVAFSITGGPVLTDHGYPLFGALCHALGNLHDAGWLAVHPLRGTDLGGDRLALRRDASLTLRVAHDRIPAVLPLSGGQLAIAGAGVQVGAPRIRMLRPAPTLVARTVTFKHHLTLETFLPHVIEELVRRGLRADVTLGKRRVVTIGGHKVVGFTVVLDGVSDDDALRIQRVGLGGRRHFGCGVFVPGTDRKQRRGGRRTSARRS